MTLQTYYLLIGAAAFSGILAGASLDQSIKQLPARRRMGVVAYAAYARAADLANGVIWYAVIGIGAALLTIAAAVTRYLQGDASASHIFLIFLAAGLAVLHTIVTSQAAPVMFSVRDAGDDEAELTRRFNRFERWQMLRAVLQTLTFAILLLALMTSQPVSVSD